MQNHLSGSIPTEMLWDTDLTYAPMSCGGMQMVWCSDQMEEILAELPGLDASLSPPNTACAEDAGYEPRLP